jgi:radical SAM protein with 4Fe4S-binding SPASM domain
MINHLPEHFGMKPGAEKFPLMVVVSFSYLCNARCPSCPYTNTTIRKNYKDSYFIDEALFKKIADECGKYGSVIRLTGGGEPMLHPRAVELIKYAKDVGAKVSLITNGSKFNSKNIKELLETRVDTIEISVDAGDEETYNKVRPGLSWGGLLTNIDDLNKIRKAYKTNVIVSAINQLGVDTKKVEEFWAPLVDKVQIRKFLTWGYNEDLSGDATPYLEPKDRIPCPWLFERLNVDSVGDITYCGEDIAFKYKITNLKDRSIEDVWTGPEFQKIREAHLNRCGDSIEMCKNCPDWKYRSWEYNYWKVIKK